MDCPHLIIDIVADQQIHRLFHLGKFPERIQNPPERFSFYPIIAVHNFEVKAGSISQDAA